MNYADAILEQTIATQRKSDRLLGRDKMNYDEFCNAIDEIIPEELMDMKDRMPICKTRDSHKSIAQYIKETTGTPYYDIYLSIKYNTPLK